MKFYSVHKLVITLVSSLVILFSGVNIYLFMNTDISHETYRDIDLKSVREHPPIEGSFLQFQEACKKFKLAKIDKWPREKIGPHGWTILHLVAARLPFDLSQEE